MGIGDRDYMKRRPEDGGNRPRRGGYDAGSGDGSGDSTEARLEAFFRGILRRHPRFFLWMGLALAGLVLVALVVAKLTFKTW